MVGLYSYTMIFDFAVLCLTGYKLNFGRAPFQGSALVQLLTLDGLLYFLIAFLANAVAVVFSALNLNPIMSVIANVPATMIAVVLHPSDRFLPFFPPLEHTGKPGYRTIHEAGDTILNCRLPERKWAPQ
ncbi:hypothetical protein MPER_09140 [Moniliophthora perniciosa FA553]|nr:hypothetical protein MPER_09140 [Moniliophthora perniciosa FA553]